MGIVHHGEGGDRFTQRDAERNILAAEIKLVGSAGIGHLELGIQIAG